MSTLFKAGFKVAGWELLEELPRKLEESSGKNRRMFLAKHKCGAQPVEVSIQNVYDWKRKEPEFCKKCTKNRGGRGKAREGDRYVSKRDVAYIAEHDHVSSNDLAYNLKLSITTISRVRRQLASGKLKPAFSYKKLHRRAIGL